LLETKTVFLRVGIDGAGNQAGLPNNSKKKVKRKLRRSRELNSSTSARGKNSEVSIVLMREGLGRKEGNLIKRREIPD